MEGYDDWRATLDGGTKSEVTCVVDQERLKGAEFLDTSSYTAFVEAFRKKHKAVFKQGNEEVAEPAPKRLKTT